MVLHRGVTLEVDAKMAAAERTESVAAGGEATARGKLRLVDAGEGRGSRVTSPPP